MPEFPWEEPEYLDTKAGEPKKPGRPKNKGGRPTKAQETANKLASRPEEFRFKNLLEATAADDEGSKLLRAAIGRGLGLTIPKAAEYAGVSERQVSYWGREPGFQSVATWAARALEQRDGEIAQVGADSYKSSLEDLLTDCRRILKSALNSDDLSLALRAIKQIEDRIFGAPTQNIKQTQLGVEYKILKLPDAAIRAFSLTAEELANLRGLPPVQEAELVELEGEVVP